MCRVEYVSKSDVVAAGIRERIERGELVPGDVLRQRDLAKQFSVSPTPVREALRKLEAEGFVATELHRGTAVAGAPDASMHESLLIRASLEPLAAELAAARMTDRDLDDVDEILAQMEECEPGTALDARLDREFHFRIYEGARSPVLLALMNLLWRSLDGGAPVGAEGSLAEHQAIAEALWKHDAALAAAASRRHVMERAGATAESTTTGR
jgi:DNA-binding GntR family transcriptional regulator